MVGHYHHPYRYRLHDPHQLHHSHHLHPHPHGFHRHQHHDCDSTEINYGLEMQLVLQNFFPLAKGVDAVCIRFCMRNHAAQ